MKFCNFLYYLIRIVNDEGTTFLDSPPVTHLAFTGSKALGLVDLFNVGPSFDVTLKENHGFLSLGEALNLVCHNKRNFGDVLDVVA